MPLLDRATGISADMPPPFVRMPREPHTQSEQGGVIIVIRARDVTTTTAGQEATVRGPHDLDCPYDITNPFPKLFGRVKSLTKLRHDWNGYGAAPPNRTALFWARRVLDELMRANFAPRAVKASPDEGVGIIFTSDKKHSTIECLNSGTIYFVGSDNNSGEPKVQPIDPDHIRRAIREIQHSFSE